MLLIDPMILLRALSDNSATIELVVENGVPNPDKFKIVQPVTETVTKKVLDPIEIFISRAAFEEIKSARLKKMDEQKTVAANTYNSLDILIPKVAP